jgi:integrase
MRRGELAQLDWEHINLKKRVAHLPKTKNGSARDVPLSPRAVEVLRALPRNLNGKVFAIRADSVTQAFERAVGRARQKYIEECEEDKRRIDPRFLVNLRFHDLRHEGTSRLAEIFPLHELAKITGHKDVRMLMRYYHPRAEDLAKKMV